MVVVANFKELRGKPIEFFMVEHGRVTEIARKRYLRVRSRLVKAKFYPLDSEKIRNKEDTINSTMIAVHPPLSALPFAFTLLLVGGELVCRGRRLQYLGTLRAAALLALMISSILAFVSGYQASASVDEISGAAEQALSSHHAWGRMLLIQALLLGLFGWVYRIARVNRQIFAALYYISLVLQLLLVIWVGHLGGELVFQHGVGVVR